MLPKLELEIAPPLADAELLEKVELVTIASPSLWNPPPFREALFSRTSVRESDMAPKLKTAPPEPVVVFPEIKVSVTVDVSSVELIIAPPPKLLPVFAELPDNTEFAITSLPRFGLPPT